jgi:hypothetical protein
MRTLKDKILEKPRAFPLEPAPYQFLFELLVGMEPEKYSKLCKSYIEYLMSCSEAELKFLTEVKELLEPQKKVQHKK